MLRRETWEPGDKVVVDFQAGECDGEMADHGIWPVVNGKAGTVRGLRRDADTPSGRLHPYLVEFDEPIRVEFEPPLRGSLTQRWQYFAAAELRTP